VAWLRGITLAGKRSFELVREVLLHCRFLAE
jgi:hypothetical protein